MSSADSVAPIPATSAFGLWTVLVTQVWRAPRCQHSIVVYCRSGFKWQSNCCTWWYHCTQRLGRGLVEKPVNYMCNIADVHAADVSFTTCGALDLSFITIFWHSLTQLRVACRRRSPPPYAARVQSQGMNSWDLQIQGSCLDAGNQCCRLDDWTITPKEGSNPAKVVLFAPLSNPFLPQSIKVDAKTGVEFTAVGWNVAVHYTKSLSLMVDLQCCARVNDSTLFILTCFH